MSYRPVGVVRPTDARYHPESRRYLGDNAPSPAETHQDMLDRQHAEAEQRARDEAARTRGEWVPSAGQRSVAAEISLTLTLHGLREPHTVVPVKDAVYRVDTTGPVSEGHPALDSIRGEYKIVNGVLWIRDEHLPADEPPF